MKKIIAFLLIMTLCAFLCACGSSEKSSDTEGKTTAEPVTEKTADTAATAAGVETTGAAATEVSNTETSAAESTEPEQVPGSEGLKIYEYDDSCIVTGMGEFTGTQLIIPSHVNGKPVTNIEEDSFSDENIISVAIPSTVRSIGEDAFAGCKMLESVTFNEGLIGISYGAFSDCSSLRSLTLPSTLEIMSNSVFRECSSLEEVTFLGNTTIGNFSFDHCSSLKKVQFLGNGGISYSLKSEVFNNDAALESVVFSEGLDTLGSFCFSNCLALKEITLPASLSKIEASVFQGTAVDKVYYAGSKEQWQNITINSGNDILKNAAIEYDFAG